MLVDMRQQFLRDKPFSMRVSLEFRRDLDALRKLEPDLPSQTEMLHRLVSKARQKTNPAEKRSSG